MGAPAILSQEGRRTVLTGVVFAMLAALCYAGTSVIARHLVTGDTKPLVTAFLAALVGISVMTLYSVRDARRDRHAPKRGFALMALAGTAGTAGTAGITTNFFALSHAPVATVAPMLSVNPLFALVLTHLFLQRLERVTRRLWIGAGLVVVGVALIALSNG